MHFFGRYFPKGKCIEGVDTKWHMINFNWSWYGTDVCGKGKEKQFVKQIIDFLENNYKFGGLIMNVISFPQGGIRVYRSREFKDYEITKLSSNGRVYEFLTLGETA